MLKIITPIILMASLAMSLLNGNAFGSPTLLALFLFSLFTGIAGMLFFLTIIFRRRTQLQVPPVPVFCFLALVMYVLADGLIREFNLTHLLFATYGLLLVTLYLWAATSDSIQKEQRLPLSFTGPYWCWRLPETIIVLLQVLHLFPVPSRWFMSTAHLDQSQCYRHVHCPELLCSVPFERKGFGFNTTIFLLACAGIDSTGARYPAMPERLAGSSPDLDDGIQRDSSQF